MRVLSGEGKTVLEYSLNRLRNEIREIEEMIKGNKENLQRYRHRYFQKGKTGRDQ